MSATVFELFARVALDVPMAQLGVSLFDYAVPAEHAGALRPGSWVVVPWGQARRVGVVVTLTAHSEIDAQRIKPLHGPLADAPVLPAAWLALIGFAADYYHRGFGEVALPAIPKLLRTPPAARARGSVFARARQRFGGEGGAPGAGTGGAAGAGAGGAAGAGAGAAAGGGPGTAGPGTAAGAREGSGGAATTLPVPGSSSAPGPHPPARPAPSLSDSQQRVLTELLAADGFGVFLLHGITGSGKTEVYLHWLAEMLARDARAQVLLLVPEIALTPQLAAQVAARFPGQRLAVLHSDLADGDRAGHWLAAVEGHARVIIGTRLAVLAPLPALAAIVVDEEHDPSYKQQEGVRYSARDLAIAAASQRRIPVLLGSATPSLESWHAARRRRYRLLELPERIGGGRLPAIDIIDLRRKTLKHELTPASIEAIEATVARGEQALVFINRRGYAPVLSCESCGWLSRCDHCSAYRVLHRMSPAARRGPAGAPRYQLVCHHCSAEQPVPRACPDCGNVDLKPLGRGTQRLEEGLAELFAGRRIARLDRDVARRRGAAQQILDAAHAGEVDILVGTQMLAKGHDFRRLTLVVAVDCDGGLFSSDFRAPERLLATLMQVAGRAGRDAAASRVIVQTRFPDHPLFGFLARHDYAGFADAQLAERLEVGLPPYRYQALLRAEAATQEEAIAFLARARAAGETLLAAALAEAAGAAAGAGAATATATSGRSRLATAHADATRADTAARLAASRGITGDTIVLLDPVPMAMSRLAGRERAQLLVEATSRPPLHRFLSAWLQALREIRTAARWQLDVDPIEI